jgi:hypothetical protein
MSEPQPDTPIGILRKTYGEHFAPEFRNEDKFKSVLLSTGTTSLAEYREHSERGMRIFGSPSDVANTIVSHTAAVLPPSVLSLVVSSLIKNFTGKGLSDVVARLAAEENEQEDQDMASLRSDETGVDNTIFVSTEGRARHAARIKIAIDPPDSFNASSKTASMAIHDYSVMGAPVPPRIAEQAKRFIELNREVLLRYWKAEISTREMLDQIRKP